MSIVENYAEMTTNALLPSGFYLRPTLLVARELLGKVFVRRMRNRLLSGRIVEVEAYHEYGDEASHSYRKRTPRNDAMFLSGGILYVYAIYGMHFCMNVVTEEEGTGAAVLIRAVEPIDGMDYMRYLRGNRVHEYDLTNGPAKCCQAFGIDKEQNGQMLSGDIVGVYDAPLPLETDIAATTRIGIRKSVDLPWRFCLKNSPFLSRRII